MTVLSAYAGHLAAFIPRQYTYVVSTGLFIYFGIKMLKDGYAMDPNEGLEELEEVTNELKRKETELGSKSKGFCLKKKLYKFFISSNINFACWWWRMVISKIFMFIFRFLLWCLAGVDTGFFHDIFG